MLTITLNLAIHPNMSPQSPAIDIKRRGKFWVFIPPADKVKNWDDLRALYEVQKSA